jgi:AcrR family transcriptional regulator
MSSRREEVHLSEASAELAAGDRRQQIAREAARLFAEKGFERTSMRDIAAASGMLAGSLYYHFSSKAEIFMEVHTTGMAVLTNALLAALAGIDDPWDRLEAVAAAQCMTLLESHELSIIVHPWFPELTGGFRDQLIRQRDVYESLISDLIAALPLPQHIDRKIFRLHFLGALNWVQTWYRPGAGTEPAEIGRQLVKMLRRR